MATCSFNVTEPSLVLMTLGEHETDQEAAEEFNAVVERFSAESDFLPVAGVGEEAFRFGDVLVARDRLRTLTVQGPIDARTAIAQATVLFAGP